MILLLKKESRLIKKKVKKEARNKCKCNKSQLNKNNKNKRLQKMEEKLNACSSKSIQSHSLSSNLMVDITMTPLIQLQFNTDYLDLKPTELSTLLISVKDNILRWYLKVLKKLDGQQTKESNIWALGLFQVKIKRNSQLEKESVLNFLI